MANFSQQVAVAVIYNTNTFFAKISTKENLHASFSIHNDVIS